jgi:arabinogalactan endo-1,4-beta-galactosidase
MTGYCNPPIETRFKKGHESVSGGRPKNSKNWSTIVNKELNELITIKEGGNTKKITKKLAVLKKLLQNALNGKSADIKMALELTDKIENDLSRTQFDDNEQSKIDSEIIENYRKSILQENKEVEI